jgi:hypothetical protein
MPNFAQFLAEAAEKGEVVNILFEERLFDLVGVLHKITETLTAEGIPHERCSFTWRKPIRSTPL